MEERGIKISFFSTGYCIGDNKHIHKGEHKEVLNFHALTALIEHPQLGKIVFDTGYSERFIEETKKFPYSVYGKATPVFIKEDDSMINQLQKMGIAKNEIDHLVISHFHGDHISGLKDFDGVKTWCFKSGFKQITTINKYLGVTKGYLKALMPSDLKPHFPEEEFTKTRLGDFAAWKWTEDIWFVDLPGHARGQMGLYIKGTNHGDVLLAADATWSTRAFKRKVYPSKIVSVFIDDFKKMKKTINNLYMLHQVKPGIKIIPTHCSEVYEKYVSK